MAGCAKPAAPPPVLAVAGTLIEGYSGQPIPAKRLRLEAYCAGCPKVEATSGADGTFRFEGVPAQRDFRGEVGGSYTLHHWPEDAEPRQDKSWLPLGGPKQSVGWGRSGSFRLYTTTAPTESDEPAFRVQGPAFRVQGSAADIGRMPHYDDELAGKAFAATCESGKPGDVVPQSGPAVMMRAAGAPDEWRYDESLHADLAGSPYWRAPGPVFVCIRPGWKEVGHYRDSIGSQREVARRTTWDVTIIIAETGERVRTSFTADPPPTTEVRKYEGGEVAHQTAGDPKPDLLAWVAKRFPPHGPAAAARD